MFIQPVLRIAIDEADLRQSPVFQISEVLIHGDDVRRHVFGKSGECLQTAAIRITREDGRLSLQIRDTGRGMSQKKVMALTGASSGVGLRGMRERLAQVGGDLTLQSDGNGTLVTAILPLDNRRATLSLNL